MTTQPADQTSSLNHFQQLFAKSATSYSREIRGHKQSVHCLVWAPGNTNKLATGSDDCTARIWSMHPSGQVNFDTELVGHTERIYQLAFNPAQHASRPQLATASSDKTIRLWDVRSKKPIFKLQTEGENINLTWRKDGSSIIVGNKQDVVSIIDVRKQKTVAQMHYQQEMNEIKWDNSGKLLMMCTGLGTIEVNRYDPDRFSNNNQVPWSLVKTISAHTSVIYCIDFDPTGKYFAAGSADSLVSIWSLPELICVKSIARMEHPIRSVSFSFDGQLIAHGSEEKKIDISHVETGEQVYEYQCNVGVNSLSWHPEEYILAYAKDNSKERDDKSDVQIVGIKRTNK